MHAAESLPWAALPVCPFHDGPETLDGLLAEIDPQEGELLDACLDLRSSLERGVGAEACFRQALRIRALLDGRHYLAFYRVRCWLRRIIALEVRLTPVSEPRVFPLPLDCARVDEVVNDCIGKLSSGGEMPPARARFVFCDRPEGGAELTLEARSLYAPRHSALGTT